MNKNIRKLVLTALAVCTLNSEPLYASPAYDAYNHAVNGLKDNSLTLEASIELLNESAENGYEPAYKKLVTLHSDPSLSSYSVTDARRYLYKLGTSGNYRYADYAFKRFSNKESVFYSPSYRKSLIRNAADYGVSKYAIMIIADGMEGEDQDKSFGKDLRRYYPILVKEQERNIYSERLAFLRYDLIAVGYVPDDTDRYSLLKPLIERGNIQAIEYTLPHLVRSEVADFDSCSKIIGYVNYIRNYYRNDDVNIYWKMAEGKCAVVNSKALQREAYRIASELGKSR